MQVFYANLLFDKHCLYCKSNGLKQEQTMIPWNIHEKMIEIFTTSISYLKFKENTENDMTFFFISASV